MTGTLDGSCRKTMKETSIASLVHKCLGTVHLLCTDLSESGVSCGCRYAGFIFAPDQHELALQKQATKRTLCKFVKLEGGEEPSQEARHPLQLITLTHCSYGVHYRRLIKAPAGKVGKYNMWLDQLVAFLLQVFFEELQHATMPRLQRDLPRPGGPGGVLAGSLQPLLGNARMKIRAVSARLALHV